MKIFLPANAIIIPIVRDQITHYFFLDSGMPYSFASDSSIIKHIDQDDIGCQRRFHLPLQSAPISTQALSEHLMLDIAGFLGIDFLLLFKNIQVDFVDRHIAFDIDDFNADHVIPLNSNHPMMTTLSIDNVNDYRPTLIDTGCHHSLVLKEQNLDAYPKSADWSQPSAFGLMDIDFYADIPVFAHGDIALGPQVVGKPLNLPPLGFDYVMGLDILSQYHCLFNFHDRNLALQKHGIELDRAQLTRDLRGLGIQVVRRGDALHVSNVLKGFDSNFAIGDQIILNDIEWDDPELINEIFRHLHSHGQANHIDICGGITTEPLFVKS